MNNQGNQKDEIAEAVRAMLRQRETVADREARELSEAREAREAAAAAAFAAAAACRIEAERQRRWRRAVQTITRSSDSLEVFGTLSDTPALAVVRRWLAGPMAGRGLMMRGGVGVGKSFAALWAVRHWSEPIIIERDEIIDGREVSWLRPDQLTSAVLHAYDPNAPRLHRHVVIDDLGRETSDSAQEALCQLLDELTPHGEHRQVLITTNLTREEMRARYEPRLLDRMNSSLTAADLRGTSLRCGGGGI